MKMIVTADLHLKLWSDKEYDADGLPKKLMEILSCLDQMAIYAKSHNIPYICIAGDINDTKGMVAVRAFVLLRRILEKHNHVQWIILHGNHDNTTGENEQIHSAIQLLEGIPNVQLIMEPMVEMIGDSKVLLLPNSKNIVEVLRSKLESFDNEEIPKILISHFGLNEGQLSSGISLKADIRAKDLRIFSLVLLGHYHTPQYIQTDTTDIYYVGSTIPVRRDEALEEKRFLVVDTDTLAVLSIPTEGYRRYCELILDEDTDPVEFERLIKEHKSQGHHIVIRKKIADIPLDLKSVVSENTQVIDMFEKDVNIRGITSGMSEKDQALKYLDIMGIAESELDEYLAVAMEIVTSEEN